MTDDEIRDLLAKATPGPWAVREGIPGRGANWSVVSPDGDAEIGTWWVAGVQWEPDARLIASAPDLAAKVLRLRAENAMMQHELERQVGIADAEADRAERAEARVAGLEAQIAAHRALKEVGK